MFNKNKKIPKNKKDPNLELAFLETSEGFFLVSNYNNRIVSVEGDEDVIEESLGLKRRK